MEYPKLRNLPTAKMRMDSFGGYNRENPTAGGFYHMENLSADGYPLLMPRKSRDLYATTACSAMASKDALCYVRGSELVINGYWVDMGLTAGEKKLVSMGAYLVIFPDKKYINTLDFTDKGNLEAEFITTASVSFTLCDEAGADYEDVTFAPTMPENPRQGSYWLDTAEKSLKQYSTENEGYSVVTPTYVRLASTHIGRDFSVGDGVEISGIASQALSHLNATAVISAREENWIAVAGILDAPATQETDQGAVTVGRYVPDMDFVIEGENRLWGCRYGTDRQGNTVNALYACKLGDFKNWQSFAGVSTDSYQVSLGSDGPFTGAVSYLGYPLFFKENCLHKVYGSYPATYQVQTVTCSGVQKYAHKTLAVCDGVLYYKGISGIFAYDGSLPQNIGKALGNTRYQGICAGAVREKYYISMTDAQEKHHIFVYHTGKKLWHREDDLPVVEFCACGEHLYGYDGMRIWDFNGTGAEKVKWMAQTAPLAPTDPNHRYISSFTARLSLEVGAQVRFFARYDTAGGWELLATAVGRGLGTFRFPIRTRRCESMELRLEGVGCGKVYSLQLNCQEGSDL